MLRGAQHDNRKDRLLRKRARTDDGWSQLILRSHKNFAGLSMTTEKTDCFAKELATTMDGHSFFFAATKISPGSA
jgi:hypothetical protein